MVRDGGILRSRLLPLHGLALSGSAQIRAANLRSLVFATRRARLVWSQSQPDRIRSACRRRFVIDRDGDDHREGSATITLSASGTMNHSGGTAKVRQHSLRDVCDIESRNMVL